MCHFCIHQNWQNTSHHYKMRKYTCPSGYPQMNFAKNHPFRVFGKRILRLKSDPNVLDPWEFNLLIDNVFSHGHRYKIQNTIHHIDNLASLIKANPGNFILRLKDGDEHSLLTYGTSEVVQMTYIFPYARSFLEHAQYIEVDGSFTAMAPYVYSIPLAMINNDSFPLGFSLAPTEKEQLYSLFFSDFEQIIDQYDFFNGRFFLSNEGKALKLFVRNIEGRHFFCYRHLLEVIGASTLAAIVVRRLLFTSSLNEFRAEVDQALLDLQILSEKGQLTDDQSKKICEIFNFQKANHEFRVIDKDNPTFQHALWERQASGVSTCSNHVERIHRTCNETINAGTRLVPRLRKLFEVINQ
jgi:hypothetical protein